MPSPTKHPASCCPPDQPTRLIGLASAPAAVIATAAARLCGRASGQHKAAARNDPPVGRLACAACCLDFSLSCRGAGDAALSRSRNPHPSGADRRRSSSADQAGERQVLDFGLVVVVWSLVVAWLDVLRELPLLSACSILSTATSRSISVLVASGCSRWFPCSPARAAVGTTSATPTAERPGGPTGCATRATTSS